MSITSHHKPKLFFEKQTLTFVGCADNSFCKCCIKLDNQRSKEGKKPSNETAILRLNWTEHFCCFSFLLTYVCQCFLFFSWTDKNKLHVLASSLWATSHLMWPLLSNTAVLPEEGGSLASKHLLWTPRTVVHFFFAKQTPRSQTASPCHTSAAERWQTTAHNIRTDTPGDTAAPNDKTTCTSSQLTHSRFVKCLREAKYLRLPQEKDLSCTWM